MCYDNTNLINHNLYSGSTAIIGRDKTSPQMAGDIIDAKLVAQIKNGDVGAYGELVQKHQHSIYALVSRMVDNRDDVDDIVQDVFVLAFKNISNFRGDAQFSTWLYRIAVNTSIKQMKKAKNRKAASIDDPFTGLGEKLVSAVGDGPEKHAENAERSAAIREAVKSLSEKHRAVVVLHYFQDLGCEEIARVMNCSVGTVWSRLHYACKKLEKQLGWISPNGESVR